MAERTEPHPWEQQPEESTKAFAAFVVYRDMGGKRSVDAAYSRLGGHQEGHHGGPKRAPGRFKKWSVDHKWSARARAYDEHHESLKQKGVDQATVRSGREWAERRDRFLRDDYDLGMLLRKQAALLANMPVVTQTAQRDGKTMVFEAVPPDVLQKAAVIAEKGRTMVWEALDRALELENGLAAERARQEAESKPVGDLTEAQRRREAWQAEQRRKLITYDSTKPPGQDGPASAPEPEPDPTRRNGSGVPPVPVSST